MAEKALTYEPAEQRDLARRLAAYGATIGMVALVPHAGANSPEAPYRVRDATEMVMTVDATLEQLARFCSYEFACATLVAQSEYDLADEGEPITHHLFVNMQQLDPLFDDDSAT